ncbi:MMPL family transporter [Actinomadura yumaensis]|uniref:MMPL family transporter n=1 Tax=Actinomadura TaxID=1988 RepID=UPI0013210098|nr:MMPL family transporter [Actinomadura sp. J1-007]MWK38848.1 MMPL family transporter [Actinomadura sp. J1-007]
MPVAPAARTARALPPAAPFAGRPSRSERLALALVRRARLVLVLAALAVAAAAPFAWNVASHMSSGGFADAGAESSRADAALARGAGPGVPNLVLVAAAPRPVDDPGVRRDGAAFTRRVAALAGAGTPVTSYWDGGGPALRSRDGRTALVALRLRGGEDERRRAARKLVPRVTGRHGALRVSAAGAEAAGLAAQDLSERDLRRSELMSLAPTFALLALVFGGLVAGALPAVVGAAAVTGTLALLRPLAELTPVSLYAVNLTTALGLGLAIDYGLILLTRYREEVDGGRGRDAAVVAATLAAGRTIAFSAVTVALSLSAMLVFPLYFLRSFAYAGIAVVALAGIAALTVLPALLAVLGPRVDAFALRRTRRPRVDAFAPIGDRRPRGPGAFWERLATAVMRRPWPVALGVGALLAALALPFAGVSFGLIDDRVLPPSSPVHQASQELRRGFDTREPVASAVLPGLDPRRDAARLAAYAAALSRVEGVDRVETGPGRTAWAAVRSRVEPYSDAGTRLVAALRAVPAPGGALVGGPAARLADTRAAVADRLPWALLIIGTATAALVFLLTGGVLLAAKAPAVGLLSLGASFGAVVHVFQEGRLRWLVGDFVVTGMTDLTVPVLMFCVAFGLSMDYEIFLLARIVECRAASGDTARAVAAGLRHTGRPVTSAAAVVAIVFAAFAASGLTLLKVLGAGLALAVVLDATLVRGLLVPAVMRLAGEANWWAPAPLRRALPGAGGAPRRR